MALNYVNLTLDLYDGQGNFQQSGTASFVPTVTLRDTTNHEVIGGWPVVGAFHAAGVQAVSLLATDNATVLPSGWGWTVTFAGITGAPAGFTFFLPFANGASQRLSDLLPLPAGATAILDQAGQAILSEG